MQVGLDISRQQYDHVDRGSVVLASNIVHSTSVRAVSWRFLPLTASNTARAVYGSFPLSLLASHALCFCFSSLACWSRSVVSLFTIDPMC
jgi:hypothetical protein